MSIETAAGLIPEFPLGYRLRLAREIAGLEQAELAERMEVSRGTISRSELGLSSPRRLVIKQWALATGVDRHWLETGEAQTSPSGPHGLPDLDSNQEPSEKQFEMLAPVIILPSAHGSVNRAA